jgi:cytochrome subunit of sulfide dehydrogenase
MHLRRTVSAAAILAAMLGAATVAAQQPAPPAFAAPDLGERGARALAASCAACHGTDGRPSRGSLVGGLAGRSKEDLVQIMTQYKSGQRPATVMHQIAKGYTDAEIAAMADHFSKQAR